MNGPPPDWLQTALAITGGFETSGDPFAAVAGDFDGQGLSCGVLQWNIGQGTLQTLAKAAGADAILTHMPIHGASFQAAIESPLPVALAFVRRWQTGGVLRADVKHELAQFCACPAMRAQQILAARSLADAAWTDMEIWETARGGVPERRSFCWFFDLHTQNGGTKAISLAEVRQFMAQTDETDICAWLAARDRTQMGYRDCHKNAVLWREAAPGRDRELFALSYLRALRCAGPSQGVMMNRKGTLAQGRGWVNATMIDLAGALRDGAPPVS
jgi:hypothetical protein